MDTYVVIILALICTFIGLLVGLMSSSLRNENSTPQKLFANSRSGLVELARILSDGKNIYLQMNGKFVRNPNDISAEQLTRLFKAFNSLLSWLMPSSSGEQSSNTTPTLTVAPPTSTHSDPSLLPNQFIQTTVKNVGVWEALSAAPQLEIKSKPAPPKSIAAQVDEILQDFISGTPLKERGIHLLEVPTQGIVVMVGVEKYYSVEEVPDEEIRSIIKAAVKEWEKRAVAD